MSHGPQLLQGALPSYGAVSTALSEGHQCQPRLSKPSMTFSPTLPMGTGGVWRGDLGGLAGSPVTPATPIILSFRSKYGSRS